MKRIARGGRRARIRTVKILDCDVLVIGSGLAGLTVGIELAEARRHVVLLTKRGLEESNSANAQGGIAVPIDGGDTVESHLHDTLVAGAGLTNPDVARDIISGGAERIRALETWGMSFARGRDGRLYDLGREGGHSRRRVLHAGDITGREVVRVMAERARALDTLDILERHMAIDLITLDWLGAKNLRNRVVGAYALDEATNEIIAVRARAVVLATGGAGKVYLYTTNPDTATGDGVAIAWRAGLPVRNMEFVQFHPTCLYHPQAKSFLISEALRGEGAELLNAAGEAFMPRYDARGALAPRDIVARAIDHEMKSRGDDCVYLDITRQSAAFLKKRFPNIYAKCKSFGIDMAKTPIPVVPAAHYFCGGIAAAVDGRTALAGLYAVGECACTGLHGANRLASNSMLEALVCGKKAADDILSRRDLPPPKVRLPAWKTHRAVTSDELVVVAHNWDEVRRAMWDYVGIVRTSKRLARAYRRIMNLRREIRSYYHDYLVTSDLLELRNLAAVAELVIRSAAMRHESRGLHYTLDYPRAFGKISHADTTIEDLPGGGDNVL